MSAIPGMRFLDARILRSISRIEIKARLLVEGMYASRHRCPFYGYSVEFVDHREYTAGDEPRTIDWKMLARTERYYVKRFEMESNMNVVCLLDASASMGYPRADAGRLSKIEYGCYLAASLAYLAVRQQDSPGLVTFDRDVRDFIPPKQGQRQLYTILGKLEALSAAAETDLCHVLKALSQRLTRRGIVILLSDCYGEPERVTDGVRHMAARGHDVVVFQILDHDEIAFPFQALTSFRDLETGAQVMSDPLVQRRLYLERLDRFVRGVRGGCSQAGADYRLIKTTDPIEVVLRDYLLYRRARAR